MLKPKESYRLFVRLIRYYAVCQVIDQIDADRVALQMEQWRSETFVRYAFENVGGQLIPSCKLEQLLADIKTKRLHSWKEIHQRYHQLSTDYRDDKLHHSLAALAEVTDRTPETWDREFWRELFDEALSTKKWICEEIYHSRNKDYHNPFRAMVYESIEEMEQVIGKIEDNGFIKIQKQEFEQFQDRITSLKDQF